MQCNESFLDDVVRFRVFRSDELSLSMPSTIPNIRSMSGVVLPSEPVLDVSYDESSTHTAVDKSISVRQSTQRNGSRNIYIYNVESQLEGGNDVILDNQDCHVVITKADGTQHLLYALPNTFSIDVSGNLHDSNVTLSLKSINDIIPITD